MRESMSEYKEIGVVVVVIAKVMEDSMYVVTWKKSLDILDFYMANSCPIPIDSAHQTIGPVGVGAGMPLQSLPSTQHHA